MIGVSKDLDQLTDKLANEIHSLVGRHMQQLNDKLSYPEMISSSLIALSAALGKLRWLATSTGEVTEDRFDQVFWDNAIKQCQDGKTKFETSN
jgi:hypothetical protein